MRSSTAPGTMIGAGVVLFGSVAASGIRTLARADLGDDANIVIVAVSLAVGVVPVAAPDFYDVFPGSARIILDSGISTGCVTAVVLNLLFHHLGRRRREGGSGDATVPGPRAGNAAAEQPAR